MYDREGYNDLPMTSNDLYVYSYDNGAYYLGKRDMDKQLDAKRPRLI